MCLTYNFVRNNKKEFTLSNHSDFTASGREVYLSNQEMKKKLHKLSGVSVVGAALHCGGSMSEHQDLKKKKKCIVASQSL